MISDYWERRLKQTGLLELWGVGFIPIFTAVYGLWWHYGFHWPSIDRTDFPDFTILLWLLGAYTLVGVACAWLGPRWSRASSDYVTSGQRALFATLHVGLCAVALFLLICVGT